MVPGFSYNPDELKFSSYEELRRMWNELNLVKGRTNKFDFTPDFYDKESKYGFESQVTMEDLVLQREEMLKDIPIGDINQEDVSSLSGGEIGKYVFDRDGITWSDFINAKFTKTDQLKEMEEAIIASEKLTPRDLGF